MLDTSKIPTKRVDGYYTHITNCITKIPQDINIELVDGLLHVYEGTTIYIPNGKNEDGSNKFDTYVLPNESVIDGNYGTFEGLILFFLDVTAKTGFQYRPLNLTYSGESDPQSQGTTYYDTETNIINSNNMDGKAYPVSLPICICNIKNNKIESIYQVFNGFGFIGSIIFITPGVEGIIPNGFNEDGSIKNIHCQIEEVQTKQTLNGWNNHWYVHLMGEDLIEYHPWELYYNQVDKPMSVGQTAYWYNPNEKIVQSTDDFGTTWNTTRQVTPFLEVFQNGETITSIKPINVYENITSKTVENKFKVVSELPSFPEVGVFYFVKE